MILRVLKIYALFLAQNFKKEMIYRANFFASLLIDAVNTAIPALFFKIIFDQNESIAGWNFESAIILVGLVGVMREMAYLTFREGFGMLGNTIRNGRLDLILTKPFYPQLLVAFKDISVNESIGEGIMGLGLIIYGVINLPSSPAPINALLFLFFISCSFFLYYSFTILINAAAFWIIKSDGFNALAWSFLEMARYPRDILRGGFKIFFTFAVPASIIATVPAQALAGSLRFDLAATLFFVTLSFFLMANFAWKRGMKRYESASS